ncbi:putative toxin-antitoxin system toxin component, PIN family [Variovorax ginsengisoli]|uniref:PIN family toxin of toxin-antitoxin system n=1 Tax=Variovorax ginsengisoli TaxID=363844 RepID=A0ABT9S7U7_9BURK|nr:putative toxin-antitoxin system toxin component, PIN family [Variovorax ginsengisoli]MDP9900414.1 putative PIN family toxin of toxin-antitoxin system [Variovorax ginsengisoli]
MSRRVVIDTNIVLDLFVFDDAAAKPLRAALEAGDVEWLATDAMRAELARVLGYPKIAPRLAFYRLADADVLGAFDRHVRIVAPAPGASIRCKDPDDQIYIDLAVAHGARLFSKDGAVRAMRKRLAGLGAELV